MNTRLNRCNGLLTKLRLEKALTKHLYGHNRAISISKRIRVVLRYLEGIEARLDEHALNINL